MSANNLNRRGIRTTVTVNPQTILPDLDTAVRNISPESSPMLFLMDKMAKGPAPRSKKIETTSYDEFDHFDDITAVTLGSSVSATYEGLALLSVAQTSRPSLNGLMFYRPQDMLQVARTGQTVMVVMTPDATLQVNGSDFTVPDTVTGNTGVTNRTAAGKILVQAVGAVPFLPITSSELVYMHRSIWESQPVGAEPAQRDIVFDYNFVEHKEMTFTCTNDQRDFIRQHGTLQDFTFQQKQGFAEFRKGIDYTLLHSTRGANFNVQSGRPLYTMEGLLQHIRSQVTVYNPDAVTDYEEMLGEWSRSQVFRHNLNGKNTRVLLTGSRFRHRWNNAFKDMRRSNAADVEWAPGLNITSYDWMGNKLLMLNHEALRIGTIYEDWAIAIDMAEPQLRVAKDFKTFEYSQPHEREQKYALEWQGTVAWHREQAYSLLRTVSHS